VRPSIRSYLLATLLIPGIAAAQTVSPEQATALHERLNNWLAGLLGPSVKSSELPLKISAAGDHYDLSWPITGLDSPPGDVAVTATLRPLEGGRWSLDNLTAPPAGSFSVKLPETSTGPGGVMKVSFTVGKQETHATIDPGFATPSTYHATVNALDFSVDGPKGHQEQHIDHMVGETVVKPAQPGRLDLTSEATANGWKSAQQGPNGPAIAFGAETMHATTQAEGIDREHAASFVSAVGGLIGAMPEGSPPDDVKTDLPPLAKAQLRLVIAAMQDMISSISMHETLDNVQVEIDGVGGATIRHVQFGFGGKAPDGKLGLWMDIGFDGVNSPTMPPKLATYLPRHFEVKPTLSGVQTAVLRKLAMDASDDDAAKHPLAPDLAAIFAEGGAEVGLETLSFDLGPAKLEGTGHVNVLSPTTWRGDAHITATGFDELTKQARENPDLQQALPVLIMMRGLAKPDGDKLVWDVASEGPKLTVNGMDMSALGGGKPKPHQPTKP
jgi:Uncharacterized protein conserved in bacteria (DUF2125)